jgi:hypothetical protein
MPPSRRRPIFHRDEQRIEAHIFVAFLAYCLDVTLTGVYVASLPASRAAAGRRASFEIHCEVSAMVRKSCKRL